MQHESPTSGMNMSALRRHKHSLDLADESVAIEVPGLNLFYGDKQALFDIALNIPKQKVTSFIGPSGCGKSTLLRCFNRMNDRSMVAGSRARSTCTGTTSTPRARKSPSCVAASAWCFKSPIRSPRRFMKTWSTGCAFRGSTRSACSMKLSSGR